MNDVPRRTAIAWVQGDEPVPPGVFRKLYDLHHEQEMEAARIIQDWERAGGPQQIDYLSPEGDAAAQAIGWPTRAAQLVGVGMAQATLTLVEIRIVSK